MFVEKEFTECCDDHDICYDTCLEDKDMCDIRFEMWLECECMVQGPAKRWSPDLVNFVSACSFTQPGDHLLAQPCTKTKTG